METLKRTSKFFQRVYLWMFLGLFISGITAYIVASSEYLINLILANMFIFFGIIILELLLVVLISGMIKKFSLKTSTILFLFYSFLNGLTISIILLVYTAVSIATTFFIAASMFGIMALYGFFTDKDLSKFGPILFMALIGLIISLIVNFFLKSSTFDFIISIFGVIIFTALTAYDNQKLKSISIQITNQKELNKYSITGALKLYLDFINLFLFLLRFLGKRK